MLFVLHLFHPAVRLICLALLRAQPFLRNCGIPAVSAVPPDAGARGRGTGCNSRLCQVPNRPDILPKASSGPHGNFRRALRILLRDLRSQFRLHRLFLQYNKLSHSDFTASRSRYAAALLTKRHDARENEGLCEHSGWRSCL